MPAGETIAPRRGPTHNVLGCSLLPEGEVVGVTLLALTVEGAGAAEHLVGGATREFAIVVAAVVGVDVEIYGAFGDVGIALVEDLLDEFYLLDDVTEARGSIEGVSTLSASIARW